MKDYVNSTKLKMTTIDTIDIFSNALKIYNTIRCNIDGMRLMIRSYANKIQPNSTILDILFLSRVSIFLWDMRLLPHYLKIQPFCSWGLRNAHQLFSSHLQIYRFYRFWFFMGAKTST